MKKVAGLFSGSVLLLVCLGVFLLFTAFILPCESAKASEYTPEGAGFDTRFFYTGNSVYPSIEQYSEEGRKTYIVQRWTFDLAWPVVYGMFCLTLTGFSLVRLNLRKKGWYMLILLPFFAVGFDFLENISLTVLMALYPRELPVLPAAASLISGCKWIFVGLSMGAAIVLLVMLPIRKLFLRPS